MGERQTVTMVDRERAMGIYGMEQCAGCPDESLRAVPQGGVHFDDCAECPRHCQCSRDTLNGGAL